ncbi:MAG: amidohydrolase family protein, partial [Vicinamibacteraceae bacterium]
EQNLKQILTHPLCVVMSDGLYVSGRPHPRLYGSFPTLLGDICRERRWLTLPEAVHKITQMPAQRFGLSRRGLIAPGAVADLVVFDPDTVGSRATYEAPERPPDGISMVFHEGRPTVPLPLHSAV